MKVLEQIKLWLSELLYRSNDIEDYFKFDKEEHPNKEEYYQVTFYTKENRYPLVASKDYLGLQVSSRKPRAGEDWTRGNDLPDGKFNEKTWNRIKNAIISYELVKIAKKERETPEINNVEEKFKEIHSTPPDMEYIPLKQEKSSEFNYENLNTNTIAKIPFDTKGYKKVSPPKKIDPIKDHVISKE